MSKRVSIVCEGNRFESVAAMCLHYGVERFKTHSRIQRGWTPEQAVGLVPHEESHYRPKAVEINGQKYENLTLAASALGVKLTTVKARIENGYTVEDAFLGRLKPRVGSRGKSLEFDGVVYASITALAEKHKLTGTLVSKRLRSGWTLAQALEIIPAPPRFRNHEGHAREQKWKQVRTTEGKIEPVPDAGGYKLYLVTNTINEKVYVGITVGELSARLNQHFAAARRGRKSAFMNAINRYGEAAFKIELLSDTTRSYDELQDQEVQEIVRRDSIRNGYNTARGGSIGTGKQLTVDGRTFPTYLAAAAHFGVDPQVMAIRIGRLKWTPEEAVGLVEKDWVGKEISVAVAGVMYPSIKQAAEAHSIDYKLVHERLKRRGWTLEQALEISDAPDSSRFAGMSVSVFGLVFKSYGECARHFGIKVPSLLVRLTEKQESVEVAIRHLQSKPKAGAQPKPVTAFGSSYTSITELAEKLGLSVHSIRNRMRLKGQSIEETISALRDKKVISRPIG
ncbi:MAG: GIY-YIG nuclease family protein [Curvibacter sp.]|nr:MAG: GIY-YIG nuclease family protein [Curvibacter sp.]